MCHPISSYSEKAGDRFWLTGIGKIPKKVIRIRSTQDLCYTGGGKLSANSWRQVKVLIDIEGTTVFEWCLLETLCRNMLPDGNGRLSRFRNCGSHDSGLREYEQRELYSRIALRIIGF